VNFKKTVWSMLAGLGMLSLTGLVDWMLELEKEHAIINSGRSEAMVVAARLEAEIHSRLELTNGMSAFVRSNTDFNEEEFGSFAQALLGDLSGVIDIQLAPAGLVEFQTNEKMKDAEIDHNNISSSKLR